MKRNRFSGVLAVREEDQAPPAKSGKSPYYRHSLKYKVDTGQEPASAITMLAHIGDLDIFIAHDDCVIVNLTDGIVQSVLSPLMAKRMGLHLMALSELLYKKEGKVDEWRASLGLDRRPAPRKRLADHAMPRVRLHLHGKQ